MEVFLWQAVLCISAAVLFYLASILAGIGFARGWNFVNKKKQGGNSISVEQLLVV